MSIADDYRAIRQHAVIGSITARQQIAVAGADRASYLQGLLTNDIQALTPGMGCYSAWLTPQGRMMTDLEVLESGDMILLDVPDERADSILEQLDRFLFGEDVRLASMRGSLTGVWVHGPSAATLLERLLDGLEGIGLWPEYRLTKASFQGAAAVVVRIDQLGVPGFCVYLEPSFELSLTTALRSAGAIVAGADAIDAVRIENGYPIFGVDMTSDTIPLEAGIENRAISFSKGCYVGQEVIIRVLHRGHGRVAKKLVGLRIEDGPTVGRGAKVLAGEREVGSVTSVAQSPELGAIALAYVHRDFFEPGTAVQVQQADGRVAATVASRPFRS